LPQFLLIIPRCRPERKRAAVRPLDAVVPVEDEESRELWTAVRRLPVDLNQWRSGDISESNPFRAAGGARGGGRRRPGVHRPDGGFVGRVAARPYVRSARADVPRHAFFSDEPEGLEAWLKRPHFHSETQRQAVSAAERVAETA